MNVRHLFVINPVAGKTDRTESVKRAVGELGLNEPYDFAVTECKGDASIKARDYILAHPDDFVRVYACGGDGTLCETAEGVYASGSKSCALGVLPIGSGNDFVKYFDSRGDAFGSLEALTGGRYCAVDMISITDDDGQSRIGLNIISAGFDAAIAKGMDKFKSIPFVNGSMAYNLSLASCLLKKTKNYFYIYTDGHEAGKGNGPYLFAIAANGRFYGGGFEAAPYSDISDGLIDFISVDTVPKPKIPVLVGKFRAGRHIEELKQYVTYHRCCEMKLVSDSMIDLNVDGEIVPTKNPVMRILPSALNLIIPANGVTTDKTALING